MKRKVKRYNEGELVDSFSEYQGFGQMGPRTIQEDINAQADEERRARQMADEANRRQMDEANRRQMQAAQAAGTAGEDTGVGMLAGAKRAAPAKAPVVTKEQMKKAGFDNLRDYLNAQQGLKRRGEPAKPAKPAKSEGPSMSSYAPDARAARSTNVSYLRKDRFGMEPDMYIARRRMKEGFKSGGKVSSASKRADGIATKGKTRGKYI